VTPIFHRSLSDLGLSCCGKAYAGQMFRSFSFNRHRYSPQTIEPSDSTPLSLAANA